MRGRGDLFAKRSPLPLMLSHASQKPFFRSGRAVPAFGQRADHPAVNGYPGRPAAVSTIPVLWGGPCRTALDRRPVTTPPLPVAGHKKRAAGCPFLRHGSPTRQGGSSRPSSPAAPPNHTALPNALGEGQEARRKPPLASQAAPVAPPAATGTARGRHPAAARARGRSHPRTPPFPSALFQMGTGACGKHPSPGMRSRYVIVVGNKL